MMSIIRCLLFRIRKNFDSSEKKTFARYKKLKALIMNKTKKNYAQNHALNPYYSKIVKARSKNYYENNKERRQEKTQITYRNSSE